MQLTKNSFFWLLCITILALFLRFYKIDVNPPSLTWDEVAWGYNAYSLGIDGKDEFGKFLPYSFLESFGDFKPPVYAYLTILPVKIFGLNEFATRFPSAFFGTFTVFVTFFLVKEIFYSSERKNIYALCTAFLLAISPWHINLSRAAFEANVSSFFIISGVWLYYKGIRNTPWLLLLSACSFVLSFYTFNTARIVVPLLLFVLVIGTWNSIKKIKKVSVLAGAIFVTLLLPILPFLLSPQAKLRFNEVNIFSDIAVIYRTNDQMLQDNNVWWSKFIHNRRLAFAVEYLRHYFDNLNPKFLFISGDGNPKFSTQDVGQLYIWELPFLIFGILMLLRRKEGYWWFIPLWLLLGIIPAATARETPHALRIETVLPTFQIFTAYGFIHVLTKISNSKYQIANIKLKNLVAACFILFFIFNFLYYVYDYYVHYSRDYSGEWQYGYKEAISYITKNESKYNKVYFTDSLGRPYAYVLFYTKYNPQLFRKQAKVEREALGFAHVKSFGKYYFAKNIRLLSGDNKQKILYIDVKNNVPEHAHILNTFYLLNSETSLVAYTL